MIVIGKCCLPVASVDAGFSVLGCWRLRVGATEVVEEAVGRRTFRLVPMAGGRRSIGIKGSQSKAIGIGTGAAGR